MTICLGKYSELVPAGLVTRFRFAAILLFLLSNFEFGWSQTQTYQFRHLNVDDGLSHNQVSCFLKDSKGFLWAGTNSGLNRFDGYDIRNFSFDPNDSSSIANNNIISLFETPDRKIGVVTSSGLNLYNPETEKFERVITEFYARYKIPDGQLADLQKDADGNFWFVLQSNGLRFFDPARQKLIQVRHTTDVNSISTDFVAGVCSDTRDGHWIIHRNGLLEKIVITGNLHKVVYKNDYLFRLNSGESLNYKMVIDSENDLWIYIANAAQGAYRFNNSTALFERYGTESKEGKLNSDLVTGIVQSQQDQIWIATDHGGVNIIDKTTNSISYLLNKPEDERSLGQNSIISAYRDDDGIIWLGTFKKGLSYYHPNLIRFSLYKHFPLAQTGLPFSDVNRFVEDDLGNLWIGTNGGGLIYFDRKKNTFRQYLHEPLNSNSISSNVVVSLCIDHENILWIGSYFGGLDSFDGKKFRRYTHDSKNPQTISDENVWEIFEDSFHRLWVGTMHGGLELFNRETNTFSHYRQSDINSVKSDYIAALTEDRNGNLWVGTASGIDFLERSTGRFFHYGSTQGVVGSLSDNYILDIREDKKGRIWVATMNGLNLFDAKSKTFRDFKEKDGLPHNNILTILEDKKGDLWLSTSGGICHVIVDESTEQLKLSFRNYDEADGLQGKQFNENAAYKTRNNEIIFGGANGFNLFQPENLGVNTKPPKVIISDFQLHNQSVRPGEEVNGSVVIKKSVLSTSHLTISPDQNAFSIEFTGLSFFNPQKNQYQYRLVGFNSDWLRADADSRKVSFTNLDPGDYEFLVKASNNDGFWNEVPASLKITVLPRFWKTRTALIFYIVVIITLLYITRKLIQNRERIKFRREQERNEAIRVHELDMMKIKFFTNVSHEFRTPLTLILTPLEKILRQTKEAEQLQQFQLIQRNAKRLLNLVNQLLDFRKLEVQELRLSLSEGDIVKFVKETVFSFSDLSEKKDIKLQFASSVEALETLFDQDKIEKILFNLLSNAFKFTPEHGHVDVDVALNDENETKFITINISDSGIGIPEDKLDKIFDRFFQNELPKSIMNQGSGIGLSITKEFVKVHGGTISVNSTLGKGSCFTVTIPLTEVLAHHETLNELAIANGLPDESELPEHKPVLLLVEDNEDFRFYLKDNLKLDYKVLEARNGLEGLKVTLEHMPDLIVSDIMMPEMNGIDLCRKIKADPRISHTPVILLTARSTEEQKLEGFETGADDYLTKPFNFEILVSRIRNLIAQREKFHKAFPSQLKVKASELKITSLDEQFIEKAIKCVEEHIAEPEFSVENLSHELGISRAHFYKKIMSLTGKSPLEFIRIIRLQQAAQLLEKSQLTVAEIAYRVGFNNPKYFARYFKDEYKVLPSAFAAEKRK
jgi:signal transduction histidine kinase/ligand-binding sensor domain-containing protein/DNA-binding response OmpR family regulator